MNPIDQIRKALEAGPTGGDWKSSGHFGEWAISSNHSVGGPSPSGRQFVAACFRVSKKDTPAYARMFEANAAFIAACNPVAIAALLASHDAAVQRAAEMERDRDEWKQSTIDGNQRFQIAERQAREMQERCAQVCEEFRPAGGRAWNAEQNACYEALTDCAAAIRAIKE